MYYILALLILILPNTVFAEQLSEEPQSYEDAVRFISSNSEVEFHKGLTYMAEIAQSGNTKAIDMLARVYRSGYPAIERPQFVKSDVFLSYLYSSISSKFGSAEGKESLYQTEWWKRVIPNKQILEANKIANEWNVGHKLPENSIYNTGAPFINVIDKRTISINGPIYRGSYEEFMKYFNNNINKIILNSSGGSILDAVKIAIVIQEKNVTATVDGECLSACANYLFIAASTRNIKEGSILCFHGGNVKIEDIVSHYMIATSDSEDEKRRKKKLMDAAIEYNKPIQEMEYKILDKYKIPHKIINFNFISTIPKIIAGKDISGDTVMSCPNKDYLENLNIHVSKMWYPDDDDGAALFDLGKKYHRDLVAVPGIFFK